MTSPHRRFLVLALACAVLASLLFLPGLPGSFVFDDYANIAQNPALQLQVLSPTALLDAVNDGQLSGLTRTIPTVSFALDYWRGGLDPAVFKVTNIVIHALTAFVLAWFFHTLLLAAGIAADRARLAAMVLTLAWALHPLQVSSVLYVVQRIQTLGTLFVVLALLAYLRARKAQIDGTPARSYWLLAVLLWTIALASKEDTVLVPIYTLALELTVLRFAAASSRVASQLRKGYLLATLVGAALYLLVIIPHYWSWDTYSGRNFSTWERLLTQARVLCIYLGEILIPLPDRMPFYYDWLQPSRGLLHPWTTLPSLLLVVGLLGVAWRLRARRPLFSLGILLFFAGHFVTSNVIGLELAFEHRNSFPLIGAILAIGDLLALLARCLNLRTTTTISVGLLILSFLASATAMRARSWNSRLALAHTSVRLAPQSLRAWNELCVAYFDLGGGPKPDNPNLGKAIAACEKGAAVNPDSITSLSNVIVFKALQGAVPESDWRVYLHRLHSITVDAEYKRALWPVINAVRNGIPLDEDHLLEALDIFKHRAPQSPVQYAAIGYFIIGHTHQPDRAYPFFEQAIQTTTDPSFAEGIVLELRKDGQLELAHQLALASNLKAHSK